MTDVDFDEDELELVTCPACKEQDDSELFGCKVCHKIVCQNCASNAMCSACEAKTMGIVTVHFR